MLEWVEEDLEQRESVWLTIVNIFYSHLDHEQDDEEEDEGGVEVGDIEGGAEAANESVAANHNGKEHCCKLRAQISHKAEKGKVLWAWNSGDVCLWA